ncbi:MAG TPA: hypothetical protein ENI95_12860 [Chloroflexi bacterium]|nr:hypothetical protein [Chloroflexota bacterium]
MQPIVDGIEEQYGGQIDVLRLNALDGEQGEAAFRFYALRGHPSLVLVQPDGEAIWVRVGIVPRETLEEVIEGALSP